MLLGEHLSELWVGAVDVEVAVRHPQRQQISGNAVLVDRKTAGRHRRRHRGEHVLARLPVDDILRRLVGLERAGAEITNADLDQSIGAVIGQRAQHDGIDNRIDGRAGADAERQHDERDDGERRRGSQAANGVSNVVPHRGELQRASRTSALRRSSRSLVPSRRNGVNDRLTEQPRARRSGGPPGAPVVRQVLLEIAEDRLGALDPKRALEQRDGEVFHRAITRGFHPGRPSSPASIARRLSRRRCRGAWPEKIAWRVRRGLGSGRHSGR